MNEYISTSFQLQQRPSLVSPTSQTSGLPCYKKLTKVSTFIIDVTVVREDVTEGSKA